MEHELPNNGMQPTARGAAADAERYISWILRRDRIDFPIQYQM